MMILLKASIGNTTLLSYMQGFPPLTNLTEFSSLNVSTPIIATRESEHVRLKSVSMWDNKISTYYMCNADIGPRKTRYMISP
jgi:hypothetical protein